MPSSDRKQTNSNRLDFAAATYAIPIVNSFFDSSFAEDVAREFFADKSIYALYQRALEDSDFQSMISSDTVMSDDMNRYVTPLFRYFAEQTDPSADRKSGAFKYIGWICKVYTADMAKDKDIDPAEIADTIRDFEVFKMDKARWPEDQPRDIQQYATYAALEDAIHPQQGERDARLEEKENILDDIRLATTVIYDGPEGKIVSPHTRQAAVFWGRQTKWCLSGTGNDDFYSYNDSSNVVMFLTKPTWEERRCYNEFLSFKFCAVTENAVYDELDEKNGYCPPSLNRLIFAALDKMSWQDRLQFNRLINFSRFIVSWSEKEDVLKAVKKKGIALQFASAALRADPEVVAEALTNDKEAARYAAPEVIKEKGFLKQFPKEDRPLIKDLISNAALPTPVPAPNPK